MKIAFDEPQPGVTIVNLTHTDVPEEDRLVLLMELLFSRLPYNELLLILSLNCGICKKKARIKFFELFNMFSSFVKQREVLSDMFCVWYNEIFWNVDCCIAWF